ncbi:hypothetical protein F3Y22_tig00110895pilonHSYRG00284 [Hibiscus syriacus]|uniref:Uncharacterized protein n=1 Tax=Hibiscus syriacus TaxID=106335 RepID=A0A6A2ZED1_HIBSY|nr:hypothetical protein F3Y22_tig00110895pilonHSYRG00284 [Hibiscus syriacus]
MIPAGKYHFKVAENLILSVFFKTGYTATANYVARTSVPGVLDYLHVFPFIEIKEQQQEERQGEDAAPKAVEQEKGARDLQKGIEEQVRPFETDESKSKSFDIVREESLCNAKVISPGSPVGFVASDTYEGEEEHEDASTSIRFSDFKFQAHVISSGESFDFTTKRVASSDSFEIDTEEVFINLDENDDENVVDVHMNVQRMVVDQFLRTYKSPARNIPHSNLCLDRIPSEEVLYANDVIQTLNYSSVVAHISGINLKAIPMISDFTSLRSVNLSNNFIGSLPKSLHTHNLSKNKINNIEGLRQLTQLRVLNLSYNRIARIRHGLSN